jgi:hypothetical protein
VGAMEPTGPAAAPLAIAVMPAAAAAAAEFAPGVAEAAEDRPVAEEPAPAEAGVAAAATASAELICPPLSAPQAFPPWLAERPSILRRISDQSATESGAEGALFPAGAAVLVALPAPTLTLAFTLGAAGLAGVAGAAEAAGLLGAAGLAGLPVPTTLVPATLTFTTGVGAAAGAAGVAGVAGVAGLAAVLGEGGLPAAVELVWPIATLASCVTGLAKTGRSRTEAFSETSAPRNSRSGRSLGFTPVGAEAAGEAVSLLGAEEKRAKNRRKKPGRSVSLPSSPTRTRAWTSRSAAWPPLA